jgi:hypothetical protein
VFLSGCDNLHLGSPCICRSFVHGRAVRSRAVTFSQHVLVKCLDHVSCFANWIVRRPFKSYATRFLLSFELPLPNIAVDWLALLLCICGLRFHTWAQRPLIVLEFLFVVCPQANAGGTWTGVVSQDRDEWRTVVNTVMNLRVA